MDHDPPGEPDDVGSAAAPPWHDDVRDALELVCEELNFRNSLVREACGLRDDTLKVLTDIGRSYERSVSELDRMAARVGPGPRRDRLRASAERSRANLEAVRERCRRLLDLDLGEPRATV